MRFPYVVNNTEVIDNDMSVTVRAERTSSWLKSCLAIIVETVLSCFSSFLSDSALCTIRSVMYGKLNESIFFSSETMTLTNLLIKTCQTVRERPGFDDFKK